MPGTTTIQIPKTRITCDKIKKFKERFNKSNKRQIQQASKLINEKNDFPRIHRGQGSAQRSKD